MKYRFAGREKRLAFGVCSEVSLAELLRALEGFGGQPATHAALRLAPYLFQRPGNVRAMEWTELDLDGTEWRIPAEKMKVGEAHVVPLAKQAVAILKDIQAITGGGNYCFPSNRGRGRPLSNNTLNAALRRLGVDFRLKLSRVFHRKPGTRGTCAAI